MKDERKNASAEPPSREVVALQRFGRGLLGALCAAGPFALIFLYGEVELVPGYLLLASSLALAYLIAISQWQKQGLPFLKAVALDTLLMYVFAAIMGVISGIISGLGGPAFYGSGLISFLLIFLGFWTLEARRRRGAHAFTALKTLSATTLKTFSARTIGRDVCIICALSLIAGLFASLATPEKFGTPDYLAVVMLLSLPLSAAGFTVVGCLSPNNRWRQIVFVGVSAWLLTGIGYIGVFSISALDWFGGGGGYIAVPAAVGGALSYLIKGSKPTAR
jgi:hypothetical protein